MNYLPLVGVSSEAQGPDTEGEWPTVCEDDEGEKW